MLTIFTIPKPFIDRQIKTIQTNAIKSWLFLQPKPEIVLYGDEEGTKEIAEELGIINVCDIKKNQFGTPILSEVFNNIKNIATNDILCYVNCDIILFQDLIETIKIVKDQKNYLLLGQRWDYNQKELIDFKNNWQQELKQNVMKYGKIHDPAGSDYFVFKKETKINMPDFAVGRIGWDNWFIGYFFKKKIKVINCSNSIFIIHQNHDYSHKKDNNLEDQDNLKKSKPKESIDFYTIEDAYYFIKNNKIVSHRNLNHFKRIFFRTLNKHPRISFLIKLPFKLIKILIKKRGK